MLLSTICTDTQFLLLFMYMTIGEEVSAYHSHGAEHHGGDHSELGDEFEDHLQSFGGHGNRSGPWTITEPGYDLRHPPHGRRHNEPVVVEMIGYSDFIESVDEHSSEVVAAMFLKAIWRDPGIKSVEEIFPGLSGIRAQSVPLPGEMKERIWVPDLYLPMARRVTIPTIRQPAESITIMANGTVRYSAFFVIAFKCPMTYGNYPMDEQQCDLDIMSYTHSSKVMRLRWGSDGMSGAQHITTRHFDVHVFRPRGESELTLRGSDGQRDVLRVRFLLRRHSSFHLLQTYVPSILLVVVGWLSLLVPLDFAYGRMVLAVTTLLVLVAIFVNTSRTSPGVNEVKAMDVWLFTCIFFVFSAIINCIADLRFLSMVEKESQIAGDSEPDPPPVVDDRLRGRHPATRTPDGADLSHSHSVLFYGNNTPFQDDKEVLIATPAVLKWLKLAVYLERGMTALYPSLFVLFMAVYWGCYLSNRKNTAPESDDDPTG